MMEIFASIPPRVMAVGAHPDDVEIGAGGSLAKWSAMGSIVTIVVCSDGGAGSPERDTQPSEIAVRRKSEQCAAAEVLGVRRVEMLGLPDGGLEDTREFRESLVRLIREHRPEVILSHDPFVRAQLVHRDHRIAGQVVLDAVYPYARDHLHYPEHLANGLQPHRVASCLLWESDDPDVVVDVTQTLAIKTRALEHHASQLTGIVGTSDPSSWLGRRSREAAADFEFRDGESFRKLDAPA